MLARIIKDDYTVELTDPVRYVDNEARKRSGHMTHAMAEFAPGKYINFNSNCSAYRANGHSAYGWIEYRISEDAGKTYSDIYELEESKKVLLDGVHTISVEKAVACDNGRIVALCLRNTHKWDTCCDPWDTPVYTVSDDGGKTWSKMKEFIPYKGRIYAAVYHKGVIYAMIFCNDRFLGKEPEHVYRIYKSDDNGDTWSELCVVPYPSTVGRGYCAMTFDKNDVLHAYAYNSEDEEHLDHAISRDFGKTWEVTEPSYVAKGVRNPQIGYIDGLYILHGRAGGVKGFVLYTSEDAVHWDEGHMLIDNLDAWCYYSNNITLRDEDGELMIIQYSENYDYPPGEEIEGRNSDRVNVMHTTLRIKR